MREQPLRPLVTLIRPPTVVPRDAYSRNGTPPLTQAYLAGSLTAAGHRVAVIDAVGEALDRWTPSYRPGFFANGLSIQEVVERTDPKSLWIGVSAPFSHEWPVARELLHALSRRFPDVPLVCGGEHANALPEVVLADVPELAACVLGEGEETVIDLSRALESGRDLSEVPGLVARRGSRLVRGAPRRRLQDLDAIPRPRWDLVPLENYLERGQCMGLRRGRTIPLLASRGCPFQCTFCSSPNMWTTRYLTRSPADVVDEIEEYVRRFGVESVDFYDLTAIVLRPWIMDFCRTMIERRVPVVWQLPSGTRTERVDEEVARRMYEAGCRSLVYAPESGSVRTLVEVRKHVDLERMVRSMAGAIRAGHTVKAHVVVGFPGEGHGDLLRTLRFALRLALLGVHDLGVYSFSAYPGSTLFEDLRKSGAIARIDDDYYASLACFTSLLRASSFNPTLSPGTLRLFRLSCLTLFYLAGFLLRPWRFFQVATDLVRRHRRSFLAEALGNLLYRRRGIRSSAGGYPLPYATRPPGAAPTRAYAP
ncbi:MAG: B12-binding domain-containing radical SAM protein [Nitrospirae bacterium]|nr:B12-binding domain-containing radical SAM protein [Nitrospirota bacterium]